MEFYTKAFFVALAALVLYGLVLVLQPFAGSMAWAAGSLYSKYKPGTSSISVNISWQMLAAGLARSGASPAS